MDESVSKALKATIKSRERNWKHYGKQRLFLEGEFDLQIVDSLSYKTHRSPHSLCIDLEKSESEMVE